MTRALAIVRSLLAAFATAIAIARGGVSVAVEPLRVVALSGQPAPGTGAVFADFQLPAINATGQTTFVAHLDGAGVTIDNLRGIWVDRGAGAELLARTGSAAPRIERNFFWLWNPMIDDAGRVAFAASYLNDNPYNFYNQSGSGIWRTAEGGLEAIAVSESRSTLSDYERFQGVEEVLLNRRGNLAFTASLGRSWPMWSSVWNERDSLLEIVSRSIDQPAELIAPPNPTGVYLQSHSLHAVNRHGESAVTASLAGIGSGEGLTRFVMWRSGREGLRLLARSLAPAPGTPAKFHFNLYGASINDAGQFVFQAALASDDYPNGGQMAMWIGDGGSTRPLVLPGDRAPAGAGEHFSYLFPAMINAAGTVAFASTLEGGDADSGVFKTAPNGIWPVALEGERTPGGKGRFAERGLWAPPAINGAGQVAFLALEQIGNLTAQGLWAEDVHGTLRKIVRAGDALEVAPGDVRTVAAIDFQGGSGLEDGRRAGINDRGQIAFLAEFTDGSSGVFVSNAVAVPEPGAGALAATPMLLAARLVKRKPARRR